MATIFTKYTHTHRRFLDGTFDWDTDVFKLALVTDSYVFDPVHTVWADASTFELSSGNGYTTGGVQLVTFLDNTKLDADDVVFSALNKTFMGAVIYKEGTVNGLVNPVLAYILFNDQHINITSPGIEFMIMWSGFGLFGIG